MDPDELELAARRLWDFLTSSQAPLCLLQADQPFDELSRVTQLGLRRAAEAARGD